jgi:hypothetical protein
MSYHSFNTAIEKAKQCLNYRIKGETSSDVVKKAEELFGHKFSKQNYEFFQKLGYLSFFGNEFYGICKDDFTGKYVGCAIEATLHDRVNYSLPEKWITLYFFDDGYYGYLDYSQLNSEEEPPVIMAHFNGEKYVVTEKVSEDLGDFLLECIEEQLKHQ